jgi:hypothetical protein
MMANLNKPVLAGHLLDALYFSVRDGKKIDNIPGLIEQLLAEDIWKNVYVEETERTVAYERFEDFVTTPPPEGLGTKIKELKRLIGNDKKSLDLLDAALQGKPGRKLNANQRTVEADADESGRRRAGSPRLVNIRRLREKHPALLQRVLNKEITVNTAMIEAGYKKKRIVVYAEVETVVEKLKTEFSKKELNRIIQLLQSD